MRNKIFFKILLRDLNPFRKKKVFRAEAATEALKVVLFPSVYILGVLLFTGLITLYLPYLKAQYSNQFITTGLFLGCNLVGLGLCYLLRPKFYRWIKFNSFQRKFISKLIPLTFVLCIVINIKRLF